MINEKELRPGNYVQNDIGTIWQLETHGDIADCLDPENSTSVEMFPISITEEVLISYGFEHIAFCDYRHPKLNGVVFCCPNYWGQNQLVARDLVIKTPESLHQLQNFYNVFTGEELELKEKI